MTVAETRLGAVADRVGKAFEDDLDDMYHFPPLGGRQIYGRVIELSHGAAQQRGKSSPCQALKADKAI